MACAPAAKVQILIAVLLCAAVVVHGNTFLGKPANQSSDIPLLEALEVVLGSGGRAAAEGRVQRLEEALRPTFLSMPKGSDDSLGPEGVRYVLHRLFVERHGWFVRGLESGGAAWNSSSPAAVFKGRAVDDVHGLFEARLGSHGFGLHHVAVLAATLESLVHSETAERLRAAYRLVELSHEEDTAESEKVATAIDAYMLLYVVGANHNNVSRKWLSAQLGNIAEVYPSWPQTKQWAHKVWQEVVLSNGGAATTFNSSMRAVEAIGDRYGRWQDQECRELKGSLLAMEEPGTGRVRLDSFYRSALAGNWQFSESTAYLRQLGALDESDPAHPSVVIPNYVNSPSNCVASSKFYSVCCIDECEALLGHLETRIAAPDAPPERIAELVAVLPSATVEAPRSLPGTLVRRLDEIAAQHGGVVPLHGRLFAQWLHHAYPRECPYPHLSGTTRPVTPEDWAKQTGESCSAHKDEMRWHVEAASAPGPAAWEAAAAEQLPWSDEEELFVRRHVPPQPGASPLRSLSRGVALLLALVSTVLTLVRALQAARGTLADVAGQKYCV